jgi:general secretion pathway protein A
MYEAFFNLRERPFELTPNPRFVVLTPGHQEALSNLQYGISNRRGITLLIGDAGTGKTTLIRTALQQQPDVMRCVYLHNPALTREEFIEILAVRFQLSAAARHSKAALLTELEAMLHHRHGRGESTVLVVDEAQTLPIEVLEEIRLLGNIETDEVKLLSIVLAGQPELAARLNLTPFRQLKQRIALRCELKPLSVAETARYLAGRIRAAGGMGANIFTREAVLMMHEHSRGIPRTLSVIADNAMVSAFALGQKPVTTQIVAEVCRDFDLHAPHGAPGDSALETEPEMETEKSVTERDSATAGRDTAPRVLAFEPAPADAPERKAAPRADLAADTTITRGTGAEMFATMYPKRSLFSFFRSVGSR